MLEELVLGGEAQGANLAPVRLLLGPHRGLAGGDLIPLPLPLLLLLALPLLLARACSRSVSPGTATATLRAPSARAASRCCPTHLGTPAAPAPLFAPFLRPLRQAGRPGLAAVGARLHRPHPPRIFPRERQPRHGGRKSSWGSGHEL